MTTATAPRPTPAPLDPFVPGARLTAAAGDLIDALTTVGVSVSPRPFVPTLGGVILDVTDGQATLSGFDYDTSTTVQVDGIGRDGRVLLSHAEMLKVLKAGVKGETRKTFGDWPVTIDVEQRGADNTRERRATVTVGGFTVPVTCMLLGDYPTLPARQDDDTISLERGALIAMLGKVGAAVGTDETLPMLTGVRAELDAGRLTFATTDRFRLAVAAAHGVAEVGESGAWLIPHRVLTAIVKTLPDGPVTVSVHGQAGQVTVGGGGTASTVRLIDAEFPRFRQLMPDTFTSNTTISRAALLKAVGKAHALCKALDTRMDVVTVTLGLHDVTIAPRVSDEHGKVRGLQLDADGSGEPVTFGVGPRYLADALATFTGDTVAVGLNGPNKPIMLADGIAQLGASDAPYRHLVMPTRLPS
jgi:DNA polymerase-3 subunit beta